MDVPSSPEESATSGLGTQREGHTTTLKTHEETYNNDTYSEWKSITLQ